MNRLPRLAAQRGRILLVVLGVLLVAAGGFLLARALTSAPPGPPQAAEQIPAGWAPWCPRRRRARAQ